MQVRENLIEQNSQLLEKNLPILLEKLRAQLNTINLDLPSIQITSALYASSIDSFNSLLDNKQVQNFLTEIRKKRAAQFKNSYKIMNIKVEELYNKYGVSNYDSSKKKFIVDVQRMLLSWFDVKGDYANNYVIKIDSKAKQLIARTSNQINNRQPKFKIQHDGDFFTDLFKGAIAIGTAYLVASELFGDNADTSIPISGDGCKKRAAKRLAVCEIVDTDCDGVGCNYTAECSKPSKTFIGCPVVVENLAELAGSGIGPGYPAYCDIEDPNNVSADLSTAINMVCTSD